MLASTQAWHPTLVVSASPPVPRANQQPPHTNSAPRSLPKSAAHSASVCPQYSSLRPRQQKLPIQSRSTHQLLKPVPSPRRLNPPHPPPRPRRHHLSHILPAPHAPARLHAKPAADENSSYQRRLHTHPPLGSIQIANV